MKTALKDIPNEELLIMFTEYEVWCKTGVIPNDAKLRAYANKLSALYDYAPVNALQHAKDSFLFECALRWKATQ